MKKAAVICLSLFFVFTVIGNVTAGENWKASSYYSFFGPDGKEYSLTSTSSSGLENGEDFLTVNISHFETLEEAQNALLFMFRKTLKKNSKKIIDSSTFFTEYSKTLNGRLNLSLTHSFMRTPTGKKVYADTRVFSEMPRFRSVARR
ncbi:MAG: hypothetical protein WAV73_04395 [Candidatus Moraniibacteriota bacterium]